MNMETFKEWLERQFMAWQISTGQRQTIEKFADYLGVSRGTLNKWMNGDRKPETESVEILALKLGLEVYDVLGLPPPDEDLFRIKQLWGHLTKEEQKAISADIQRRAAERKRVPSVRRPQRPAA